MLKILYVTNYPSPYAVDFFNELGKKCALTVSFEQRPSEVQERDSQWFSEKYVNFTAVFPQVKKIMGKSVAFGIKKYLTKDFDFTFMGEYSSLTEMYAIRLLKKRKLTYGFAIDGGIKKDGKGFKEKLKRSLLSGAQLYLSSGKVTDEFLTFYGAAEDKIVRYPFTSLNDEDILPDALTTGAKKQFKNKLNMSESKIVISVGQFIHRKGFDLLIKATNAISSDTGIYIIGSNPTQEYLELARKSRNKNIHFIPFMSKKQLKEYYYAADLFVLPTREDIWGLVINEAMAAGLPVVTTTACVAGVELVDEGKGGFVIPVDDIEQLAEKINAIVSDETLCKNMSIYNLHKINKYTIKEMAEHHINAVEALLKK